MKASAGGFFSKAKYIPPQSHGNTGEPEQSMEILIGMCR